MKKNILTSIATCFAFASIITSCNNDNTPTVPQNSSSKSIVVLYDNDVHCGVEGYTKIAGLRNAINATDTAECIIVSSGDYIQGGTFGVLSSGEYIINIMNAVGYSAATIGNHEFDYGGSRLFHLISEANFPITCVNFSANGSTEQYYKPYIMTEVAGKKLAFVGVLTPSTVSSEYYSFYDQDHNLLYDLYPQTAIQRVQQAANDARTAGADYVICLSHLGEQYNNCNSIDMIQTTNGIDVVLDGHTHSIIADSLIVNKDGKFIPLTQTGTQFANIGKLTFTKDDKAVTQLLKTSDLNYSDNLVDVVCDSINKLVSNTTSEELGTTDHTLSIYDTNGQRLVRKEETTIGDFVADAFRYSMQTEIGIVNGGGVRTDLKAGTITFGDIINVSPFFNDMAAKELTGKQIRQLLTHCYSLLPKENGSFAQISGLRVTIDLTSSTPTITDLKVEDKETGIYTTIDDNKTYSVGSTTYVFELYSELAESKDITPELLKDAYATRKYLVEGLNGNIGSHYTETEGRITIIK